MSQTWTAYLSEAIGTALLMTVGLSIVILGFGTGSPVVHWIPDPGMRRLLAGALFGTTGALIAVSPVGRVSGAHINPAVTFAFWLRGRMPARHASAYAVAQCAGAIAGTLPLLAWGAMGASIDLGATLPGAAFGAGEALAGELVTTALMVALLFAILGHRRTRAYAPLLFPPLYAVLVYLEAPVSGTSTNPARSLGPSLVAGVWHGWWVYWIGPIVGAAIGVWLQRVGPLRQFEIEIAKIHHFEHDPSGIFAEIAGRRHRQPS